MQVHTHVLLMMGVLSHPYDPWGVGVHHTYSHGYIQGWDIGILHKDEAHG